MRAGIATSGRRRRSADGTRRLRTYRYRRGNGAARYDTFEVPIVPSTTVLEALQWIRSHRDPTLAIRHSCLHASCGTCGLRVNGREALACVTVVADLSPETVTVEPMANISVVADLVVDMSSFVERFPDPHPSLRTSELPAASAETSAGTEGYERFEDCIECGLCLSACPVAATDDSYVGPAALAYAQRLLEEHRGAHPEDILVWAGGDGGAWRCHASFECTEACPSDVRPAQRIMALRRELIRRTEGAP